MQASTEADVLSNIIRHPSYRDDVYVQETDVWCGGSVLTNFQSTFSPAGYVEPLDIQEVTSSTNCPGQGQFAGDDELLDSCSRQGELVADEEFLEIKDLNDPDSAAWRADDVSNEDHIPVSGSFIDTDDYFDADMYLAQAMGPGNGIIDYSLWDGLGDSETQNQASQLATELWTHEQNFNVSTAMESNLNVMASSTLPGA